jgi:hypothetical protein
LNQGSYKPSAQATKTGKTFQTGYGDGTTAKGQVSDCKVFIIENTSDLYSLSLKDIP